MRYANIVLYMCCNGLCVLRGNGGDSNTKGDRKKEKQRWSATELGHMYKILFVQIGLGELLKLPCRARVLYLFIIINRRSIAFPQGKDIMITE